MPPRKLYELPPALQTRQANKGKVVGAPDMPSSRRSHEEVLQEKAQKASEKARAATKKDEALARAAEIQARLAEDAPTISTRPAPEGDASSQPEPRTLRSSVRGSANKPAGSQPEREEAEPQRPLSTDNERPRSNAPTFNLNFVDDEEMEIESRSSGDEFTVEDVEDDGEEDDGELEVDVDASDSENEKGRGAKGKGKEVAAKNKGSNGLVGKRKHESSEPTSAKKPKNKKVKHATTSRALVPGWEKVLEGPSNADLPAPTSHDHDNSALAQSQLRPPSRARSSTSLSSVPPSTASGDTSEGDLYDVNPAGGFADDARTLAFEPPEETHLNDIRDAIRYRDREASRPQAGSVNVAHPTTQVIVHTSAKTHRTTSTTKPASSSRSSAKRDSLRDASPAAKISNSEAAPVRSKKAPKAKLEDLPPVLRKLFTERFVPLTRQYLGTLSPWSEVALSELQALHRRAFGTLANEHPLDEGDPCFKLITSRNNDWRSNFSLAAIATFRQILGDLEEQDPDTFAVEENKAEYAKYLLGDAKKAAPFYWAEWNNGTAKKGRLQGPIILGAFASHLEELRGLPATERTREHASGALAMAVVASLHTLTHFQTGGWRPPKGRAGWFSYENYADTAVFVDGKTTMDKRMTRVLKVVNALSEDEWNEIECATNEIIDQRKAEEAKGGRRRRSGKKGSTSTDPAAAAGEHADGHASDDSDLMLVADG